MKRIGIAVSTLSGVLFFFACEPITVSVAPDGRIAFTREEGVFAVDLAGQKLTTIHGTMGPEPELATVVRWSPDGSRVAYVLLKGKGFGEVYELWAGDPATQERTKLLESQTPILYLGWSPDGKSVTAARGMQDDKAKGAEILVVEAAGGEAKTLAREVSAVHHWTAEGKVVLFQVAREHGENTRFYVGSIATVDPGSGTVTGHVNAASGQNAWLCLSPDGKRAAFLAVAAAASEEGLDLPAPDQGIDADKTYAFTYDFESGKLEKFRDDFVHYVLYSPDGAKAMFVTTQEDRKVLQVRNLAARADTVLDPAVVTSASRQLVSVPMYPVWLDDDRIFYWKERVIYGRSATSLSAHVVQLSTGERKNVQHVIDRLVDETTSGQ
ncbi:MAG: hypothetical protein HY720_22215 [Planctomycetes bacterium]|nr:hypothetical protein [Planctomycetota bacterium]